MVFLRHKQALCRRGAVFHAQGAWPNISSVVVDRDRAALSGIVPVGRPTT
jgi:hypothetical protein